MLVAYLIIEMNEIIHHPASIIAILDIRTEIRFDNLVYQAAEIKSDKKASERSDERTIV